MTQPNTDLGDAIDARLNDAVAAANYRITLNNQKQNAKLKLQNDLSYSINGGIFNISLELISFVNTLLSNNKNTAILLDIHKNPIEITDLQYFSTTIIDRYFECMNDYLIEYKNLNKQRTTKSLIGE